MGSIILNLEEITNTKTTVNYELEYIHSARKEVENAEFLIKKYNMEVANIIDDIIQIESIINKYNMWIDDIIDAFNRVEIANANVISSICAAKVVSAKLKSPVTNFSSVGRAVPVDGGGGSKSTNKSSSTKSNSTSLSQAEIDYREGRTPGYSKTSSSNNSSKNSSSKSSSKKSSDDDTGGSSNSAPQQSRQEIAEESNSGLIKWLVEQMKRVGNIASNSTSLSQAEVDYREGRTPGYSKTSSINKKITASNSTSLSQAEVDYREGRTAGYSKTSSINKKTTAPNSTSLSQAEVDYREGRTPGYSKTNFSNILSLINSVISEGKSKLKNYIENNKEIVLEQIISNLQGKSGNVGELSPSILDVVANRENKLPFNYKFYSPGIDSNTLLVYFNSTSECGNKLGKLTGTESLPYFLQNKDITPDVYVLMLQASDERIFLTNGNVRTAIVNTIADYAEAYGCDNVILSGHSLGANTATGFAAGAVAGTKEYERLQDLVCGLACVSGREYVNKDRDGTAEDLEKIPTLIVVGGSDEKSLRGNQKSSDKASRSPWIYSWNYLFGITAKADKAEKNKLLNMVRENEKDKSSLYNTYIYNDATLLWDNKNRSHGATALVYKDDVFWDWIHSVVRAKYEEEANEIWELMESFLAND